MEYLATLRRYVGVDPDVMRKYLCEYEDCTYKYYIDKEELEVLIEELKEEAEEHKEELEALEKVYNIAKEEGILDNEDYIEFEII